MICILFRMKAVVVESSRGLLDAKSLSEHNVDLDLGLVLANLRAFY